MDRLSAGARSPGAPPSYPLRIGLIAEGLATKRARLGDLTRRVRGIEADITAHPSGVYPSLMQPSEAVAIASPQASAPPAPLTYIGEAPAASPGLVAEPAEPTPVYTTPIAEPHTHLDAPIIPEKVVPTPDTGMPAGVPFPDARPSPSRRGLVWAFVVATVLVLSLLITGLLADARRGPPFPQPGSPGSGPALLRGQVAASSGGVPV